jgi:hypothetical protein
VDRHRFRGVHAKLDRAKVHIDQFADEVEGVIQAFERAITVTIADGVHRYVLTGAPSIPLHWSALFGDAMHNLRSALDHLAWQLVLVSRGTPTRKRPATTFPIRTRRPEAPLTISGGVHPDLLSIVEEIQPYTTNRIPALSPLAIVAELNNVDKHVDLLTVGAAPGGGGWWWPEGIEIDMVPSPVPVADGEEVGFLVTRPPYNEPIAVTWSLRVRIDRTAAPDLPAAYYVLDVTDWLLERPHEHIGAIVARFEAKVDELGL